MNLEQYESFQRPQLDRDTRCHQDFPTFSTFKYMPSKRVEGQIKRSAIMVVTQRISSAVVDLNSGLKIPQVHLGVFQADNRTKTAVKWALEAGYRGFDSAEVYGNEKDVGSSVIAFLKTHRSITREAIWFTTKLRQNTSYEITRQAIKGSIKRTKLGYIDLYLLHTPAGGREKRLECWRALEDALSDGEVKCIGVSNWGMKHVCPLYLCLYPLS
jgi:diketogulonate reductase-like aldo/keto reductase